MNEFDRRTAIKWVLAASAALAGDNIQAVAPA